MTDNKSKIIIFRVTEKEHNRIKKLAAAKGMFISGMLRLFINQMYKNHNNGKEE